MLVWLFCVSLVTAKAQSNATNGMPRLVKTGQSTQLLVDNKPFFVLGGELGNSTASNTAYMQLFWPKLKAMNLNTVIAPVYWELMEPTEGKFDFTLVDDLLRDARKNQMKLVLLWFGAWKNSMSCYAPAWVKTDLKRFPRVEDDKGVPQEIMTPFEPRNLEADRKAFVQLMQHLKEVDGKQHTVVTVQVENEIGMLPTARSYDARANAAFKQPVPAQLLTYLQRERKTLKPEFAAIWQRQGAKTKGTWEEVFGKSLATDEMFMAWYFATYTNAVAAAGKAAYPLPMYVNAALNRPGVVPGKYPSAGPLPHLMDIWLAGAPDIDILAPDFYNPNFEHWCDLYTRGGNPLFIPEHRFEDGVAAKAFFAFGNYNCLSFSPFAIEGSDTLKGAPISKAYELLQQVSFLLGKHQPQNQVRGFLVEKDSAARTATLGDYRFTAKHEYTLGWSLGAKKAEWTPGGGLIIAVAPDEFYVVGTGIVLTCEPTAKGKRAGYVSVDEGHFEGEKWIDGRRMNGDQDHQGRHVRVPGDEYSIQRVKLYTY
ncbi:mannonate dehydratase [Hymenobacter jejuensis]|uniref:Mannonate dehydratase n=2 Tax=Hymenobacter jejuensis TaxID=2502781 RepID=A0A5B8A7J1_9BACT|nr:mannonate dehydratase [Hymenobacter jejuensis]